MTQKGLEDGPAQSVRDDAIWIGIGAPLSGSSRFSNRDDITGAAIGEYLFRTLRKRLAVVIETGSAYGKSMAEMFARHFSRSGGQVIFRKTVQEGERDFDRLVNTLPSEFD